MPAITIKDINNYACHGTNLEVKDRELLFILGPNGSGKTTLLNTIAGLIDYTGSVMFDGKPIDQIPASKREVGYLFQNLVLFPHMDIQTNIAYSLKMKKWTQPAIEEKVNELLKMLNIKHLALRYPGNLSGGEKQRVALARALALSPKVLLLDEPMSSLDAQTAKYLRIELKQLQRRLGITAIHVSHDLSEALTMADRVAIILNGKIVQVDEPEKLLFYPCNEDVCEFIGSPNILECDCCANIGQGVIEADCGGLKLLIPHDNNAIHRVSILPHHIYVSDSKPPGHGINSFMAKIKDISYCSNTLKLSLELNNKINLVSEIPYYIAEDMKLEKGKDVYIILRMTKITVFENKGFSLSNKPVQFDSN